MFRALFKAGSWLANIGRSETEKHYAREADRAYEALEPDFADPAPDEPLSVLEPNIEPFDFGGSSTDIQWMTYNHDTQELIIQFLEHGKPGRQYAYQAIPVEEFEALKIGLGPFPAERNPRYYQKPASTGQRANFYLRNDQQDDLYEYERLD